MLACLDLEIIRPNTVKLKAAQLIDAATGIHAQQDQFRKHVVTILFRSIDDRPTFSSAIGKIGVCLGPNAVLPCVGLLLHRPSRIDQIRDLNVVIVQRPISKLLHPV